MVSQNNIKYLLERLYNLFRNFVIPKMCCMLSSALIHNRLSQLLVFIELIEDLLSLLSSLRYYYYVNAIKKNKATI